MDSYIICKFTRGIYETDAEIAKAWNGIMLRVLGQEGKIKGIVNYSNNKIADSILRLMGLDIENDSELK